jgi:YVTN family beta-propeller protein
VSASPAPEELPGLPDSVARANLWTMVACVFVVFTGFAFVLPFMPLYVRELGVLDEARGALWAGLLIAIAPLLAGLLAPVWGRLADRHGQKPMAVRALVAYVVLLLLSAAAQDVWQLLALRIGIGLFGGIGPLGLAMATASLPREQTGQAVGKIQAAQILAAAVGPLSGGLLADAIGIRSTFVLTAVLCAIALAFVLRYYTETPRRVLAADEARAPFTAILGLAGVLPLLVVLFLVNFIGRSFTPILPLQLGRLGIERDALATSTGLLISVYSICAATSATLLGRASRRRSPRAMLIVALAAGAVTVLPLAWAGRFATFVAFASLLGLASGGALTLCYTIGGLMVPAAHRTAAFGFFSAAALFGGSVSPLVAGALVRWDFRGIYLVDAILFVVLAAGLLAGFAPAAPKASGLLLVANKGDHTLSIIDPALGKQVAAVEQSGVTGHEVCASPDGTTAYVPIYGNSGVGRPGTDGSTIDVIDIASRTRVATIDLGQPERPHDPVFGADGRLYVTGELSKTILVIDPKTRTIVDRIPTGERESHMVALTRDGKRAFTSNVGAGSVSVIDVAAKKVLAVVPVSASAQRIALSVDEKLVFTADQKEPRIVAIDTATHAVARSFALPATGFATAPTPDGKLLLVTMPSVLKMVAIDLQSGQVAHTIELPGTPQEVIVRPDGKSAFVSCDKTKQVAVVDLATFTVEKLIAAGTMADGLAFVP